MNAIEPYHSTAADNGKEVRRSPHTRFERMPLGDILRNRRWLWRNHPFPHIVADNVFHENVYRSLEKAYQNDMERMFQRHSSETQSALHMKNYDAYGWGFTPNLQGPLSIFISRPWHDMLASIFGINASGDINGGAHHHTVGSKNGFIHNDFNPAWFVARARPDGINVSDARLCNYKFGTTFKKGVEAYETVRAIAMLFYLNNPPWLPGDGGETGLYWSSSDPVDKPAAAVPPINNSMLIFECTPYSFHSFISNRRHHRNSIILWLHRSKNEAISHWDEVQLERWK